MAVEGRVIKCNYFPTEIIMNLKQSFCKLLYLTTFRSWKSSLPSIPSWFQLTFRWECSSQMIVSLARKKTILSRIYLVLNCELWLYLFVNRERARVLPRLQQRQRPKQINRLLSTKYLRESFLWNHFFRMKPWPSPADPHRFSGYLSSLTFDHLGTLECH